MNRRQSKRERKACQFCPASQSTYVTLYLGSAIVQLLPETSFQLPELLYDVLLVRPSDCSGFTREEMLAVTISTLVLRSS